MDHTPATNDKKGPTSIWPGPALLAYVKSLGPRPGRAEGLSRVVDSLAARYAYITRAALPICFSQSSSSVAQAQASRQR